jgi:hypothetical protein
MSAELIERLHDIATDDDEAARDRINAIELILAYGYGRPIAGVVTAHIESNSVVELGANAPELDRLASQYAAMIQAGDDADDPGPPLIEHKPAARRALDVDFDPYEDLDEDSAPVAPRRQRVRRPQSNVGK